MRSRNSELNPVVVVVIYAIVVVSTLFANLFVAVVVVMAYAFVCVGAGVGVCLVVIVVEAARWALPYVSWIPGPPFN
jgi:hypothetical protein